MKRASAVATLLAVVTTTLAHGAGAGQGTAAGSIGGSASKQAKAPYTDYVVRARIVDSGQVAASTPLDSNARFVIAGLAPSRYLMELVDRSGKVICTEGPYTLTAPDHMTQRSVEFSCGRPPALWIFTAAALAGISAGLIAMRGPASPSK